MVVNSTTARADVFKEIYKVLKDNVTTSGVTFTNSFVDDIAKVPQVVVQAPTMPKKRETFGTTPIYNRDGEIEIEVYAKTMKDSMQLLDDVENTLIVNKGLLSVQNIQIEDSVDAKIMLGSKVVHAFMLPISFTFRR